LTKKSNHNETELRDVIIIGGGPAGISAAVWCADLGLNATLFERSAKLGGQLNIIHTPVLNYPGVITSNGDELRRSFEDSLGQFEVDIITGNDVISIDVNPLTVTLSNGETIGSRAVFLATGVRRRRLGVAGERRLEGKGVLASGAGEREAATGKRIVIVGGGDAAFENALILRQFAKKITLVHRGASFRARPEFLEPVLADPDIDVITGHLVQEILGHERVEGVTLKSASGDEKSIETDLVLIRIGVEPNTELVAGKVDLDADGYVKVDSEGRTSCQGIWAIGDVAHPVSPTIATAVGTGAAAAKSALKLINSGKRL
jgi:thioredoxin reductase (NADPH)